MGRATVQALAALLVLAPARALASTEVVLILDNSGSMINGAQVIGTNEKIPAADPDRLSVLGTLILAGLLDADDQLTILAFQQAAPNYRAVPTRPNDIRELEYDAPTLFAGAFAEARRILGQSQRQKKLLILLTDGMPTDIQGPADARSKLGIGSGGPLSLVAIGLAAVPQIAREQSRLLGPLVEGAGRYEKVADPRELITRMTQAYADTLGSRPLTATLGPGKEFAFQAGRYVAEVMVMTASVDRQPAAPIVLREGGRTVDEVASGDNGCRSNSRFEDNPRYCKPPFNTYKVWKAKKDPDRSTKWTVALDAGARSDVALGVILRYELGAEILSAPDKIRVGEPFEVTGRMRWRDATFDEPAFFTADDFSAYARIGDKKIPLVLRPGAVFAVADTAQLPGSVPVALVFENRWMRIETPPRTLTVEGFMPLSLIAGPLDFGRWRGEWRQTRACRTLDLAGSDNADKVPLELTVESLPVGVEVEVDGARARTADVIHLERGKTTFEMCVVAERCCVAANEDAAKLSLRGRDPHYHAQAIAVRVHFVVEATGLWRCWWPLIAGVLALIVSFAIVYGIVSPLSFEEGLTIRLGKKPAAVDRARRMLLAEQPGGKRGFYRHATAGFDASGNGLPPRTAALLRLTAGPAGDVQGKAGGTLEVQSRRTRKWEPVSAEDTAEGIRKNVLYRVADFYFKVG